MENVVDLDILKPESRKIRLNGMLFDISFVPCGITFEIDRIIQQLASIPDDELRKGKEATKNAFDLTLELCVSFASFKHPELSMEWFRDNVSAAQIQVFAESIKSALLDSYKGLEQYGKN